MSKGYYKRRDTYYSKIFFPGHPRAGNDGRLRIRLDTDEREAIKKVQRLIEDRDAKKHGRVPKHGLLENFLEEDFWPWSRTQNEKTHSAHKRAFSNLLSAYPVKEINEITPRLLQKTYIKWKEAGRGLYVRNKDLASLKSAMRKAEEWKWFSEKQDWESVKPDPEPEGRLLWYTEDQLRDLSAVCHGVWETIFLLAIGAGMRRSEIYWLSWENVDFSRKVIHVSPVYDENGKMVWEPKRGRNQKPKSRVIPMIDFVADHLAFVQPKRIDRWVISENGLRPTPGTMTAYFGRLSHKAGLKGTLHTLRHSFASHLVSRGQSLEKIGKLLGHDSPKTTKIYAKVSEQSLQDAIKYLPQL